MRIGVDMLGAQDVDGRGRGIGRYVERFIDALVRSYPADDYLLYYFDRLGPPPAENSAATTRVVPCGRGPLVHTVQNLVDHNRDRLDFYLVTSPFSWLEGYRPPVKPVGRLRIASILYDLTPMAITPAFYLDDVPGRRKDYFERLARVRDYDLIFAISEATRADALARLHLPPRRVVNISSATREGFFAPAISDDLPQSLAALGVRKPYLLGVASTEPHKNRAGLIRAFARLPADVRAAYQLVLYGGLDHDARRDLADFARQHGVGDRIQAVGRLADEQLREIYQHCTAFAFFSHCEGFGLPILEAMLCGAPVVAGANSSQIEVVGEAGLTADAQDEADMAAKLQVVLADPGLAAELRRRGQQQALKFSWAETVRRAHKALAALPPPRDSRPLLALVAPPHGAAADYALAVLQRLQPYYAVHIYHEAGQMSHAAMANSDFAAFDCRLFGPHDRVWNYSTVVYLMDEAGRPDFVRELFLRRPGVVLIYPGREAASSRACDPIGCDGYATSRLRAAFKDRFSGTPFDSPGEECAAVIERAAADCGLYPLNVYERSTGRNG